MGLAEPRERWGSDQADPPGQPIGQVAEVIVHHSWRPHVTASASVEDERRTMRGMQDYHVDEHGWDDIGYQFAVFQSGRAYVGRGWGRSGAHTEGRNFGSVAFCFVIDGDKHVPTEAAWRSARALIGEGIELGHLAANYRVSGHTDYAAKSCPGTRTYPLIGRLRPGAHTGVLRVDDLWRLGGGEVGRQLHDGLVETDARGWHRLFTRREYRLPVTLRVRCRVLEMHEGDDARAYDGLALMFGHPDDPNGRDYAVNLIQRSRPRTAWQEESGQGSYRRLGDWQQMPAWQPGRWWTFDVRVDPNRLVLDGAGRQVVGHDGDSSRLSRVLLGVRADRCRAQWRVAVVDSDGQDGEDEDMRRGDSGPTVKFWQVALRDLGFDPGRADGAFGPNTEEAVRSFQRSLGIADHGRLDVSTVTLLAARARVSATSHRHVGDDHHHDDRYASDVHEHEGTVRVR